MIIVTGGAGFIGSNIVKGLNEQGRDDILVVDNLTNMVKFKNIQGLINRRQLQPEPIQEEDKKKRGPKVEQTLNFKVHPHLLRHTYITRLCESGMDIKKIQYLAGHSDIKMTLNVYSHVVGNSPKELIGAVENAFSGQNWGQNAYDGCKKASNTNENAAL